MTRMVRADRRALLKTGLLAAGLSLLLVGPAIARPAQPRSSRAPFTASLGSIDDGDSFSAHRPDGTRVRIRLAGIDAPERTQAWAGVARRRLAVLLDVRSLKIVPLKTDPWGRFVALVEADGTDPAEAMLEAGLAWHFTRYDRDLTPERRARYAAAQARARAAHLGLWQEAAPEAPWDFRRRARDRQATDADAARILWRSVS